MNLNNLTRNLQAAHIAKPAKKYLLTSVLAAVFSLVSIAVLGLLLYLFKIEQPILSFIPNWFLFILILFLVPTGIFFALIYYPNLEAGGRKSKIDLDLPYAITYMQALSSTIPLYDIFKSVFEADDLYGEVSKECGLIVRDVELFGMDLVSAIEATKKITPSDNFRELLNDLLLVHRSGGNLTAFFNAKSEGYREIARNEMDSLLQFLEMIAEVYVTAFLAGPIAIIIMLVAQNLTGQNTLGNIMPLMYIGLPLGAIVLIVILYIILPPDNLKITRKEITETEYSKEILAAGHHPDDEKYLRQIKKRKHLLKIQEIFRHPLKFFIADYSIAAVMGGILTFIVFLLWYVGIFADIFPVFTLQVLLSSLIIAAIFPLMAAYELRNRYVTRIEKQLPEFLREIADMRDIGMTLPGAIGMIAGHKSGVLSTEISIVAEELKYGSSLSGALVRMEERIGLTTVKRAISLLVKASEVTDYIREILGIAVADLEHYLKMKNKRMNVSFVYLAVIYLSFGIYLFAAYEMNVAFISSFSSFNISFDLTANKLDMFHIGIILAFFSGIMAGQLSSNTILAGLKHSIVMLIMTIITFVYLI
ncbi:MAG: type II secretion system F family protein [Methanocorpusculum sp.]|uniref:type II secretion system F family protein n=1 Tax=Methanocorpusculum sp. TaxID=2058474 RepID=UPI002717C327|nr:type II secretion system F family protein [Methanocorpusculum sp.]MDO9523028.1 type II secretion system F family protein [Methanocorpusculum sp.]